VKKLWQREHSMLAPSRSLGTLRNWTRQNGHSAVKAITTSSRWGDARRLPSDRLIRVVALVWSTAGWEAREIAAAGGALVDLTRIAMQRRVWCSCAHSLSNAFQEHKHAASQRALEPAP